MSKRRYKTSKKPGDPTYSAEWSGVTGAPVARGVKCPKCGGNVHNEDGNMYCPYCDDYVRAVAKNPTEDRFQRKDRQYARRVTSGQWPSDSCKDCKSGACCQRPWHHSGDVCAHCGLDERGDGMKFRKNRGPTGSGAWKPGALFVITPKGQFHVKSRKEGEELCKSIIGKGKPHLAALCRYKRDPIAL